MDDTEFRALPPEFQGLFRAFAQMTQEATANNDLDAVRSVWRKLKAHSAERDAMNKRALNATPEVGMALVEQIGTFEKGVSELFGEKYKSERDGRMIVSTRGGGFRWVISQGIRTLLTPTMSTKEVTKQTNRQGATYVVGAREHKIAIDPRLFDDMVQLHPDGIHIFNADSGQDETVIPWDQSRSLAFGTNASAYVDWINERIRPLFKGTAQSQWIPWGTFTIKDRQSGQILVTALLNHPAEFRKKLEKLRDKMVPVAIRVEKLEAKEPLNITDAVNCLPVYMREKAAELLGYDLEDQKWLTGRHYAVKLGEYKAVFQGEAFNSWEACVVRIEEVMENIRTNHPEWLNAPKDEALFITFLKSIAKRFEPFAGGEWKARIKKIVGK